MPDLDRFEHHRHLYHDDFPRSEVRERLHEAVRRAVATELTGKQREIVEAHYFEGISQGEIARRMGVSQQVVQRHIHGALRDGKSVGGALRKLREVLTPLLQGATTR